MDVKNIIPIWQTVGWSTNHLTRLVAEKIALPTAHTGTLDPMAEGVVIVLTGDKRLEKIKLAARKKTYEFEICFGISTDSYDGLGLITKIESPLKNIPDRSALETALAGFVGSYTQNVPPYSAIKHLGKKLFVHAQQDSLPKSLPTKAGEIYSIQLTQIRHACLTEIIENLREKITKVTGPLRQEKILACWNNLPADTKTKTYTLAKIKVEVSRGMYVRSLSQDICKKLNVIGFITGLVRTQNGVYNRENCLTLDDLQISLC